MPSLRRFHRVGNADARALLARRLRRMVTILAAVAAIAAQLVVATPAAQAATRSTTDRPDDRTGKQVHYVYALPSDGTDRNLDVNGTLAGSVASYQAWLSRQTGGQTIRTDTYRGALDITFFRSTKSDATLSGYGANLTDELGQETRTAGLNDPNKIYFIYYDGTNPSSCGDSAVPSSSPAEYLHGLSGTNVACDNNPWAGANPAPGYRELTSLHEIVHALGFVPSCAPHANDSHVSDDPDDLMWAGSGAWMPDGYGAARLDSAHDDYYHAGIYGCPDLAASPYLTTVPADTTSPVVVTGRLAATTLVTSVPVHYSASDRGSGVDSVNARWRRASIDGAYRPYVSPAGWTGMPAGGVVTLRGLISGWTYCFSFRARDAVGNVSAWTTDRCTAAPLDDRGLKASTGWVRSRGARYYLGTATRTATVGRTLTRKGVAARRIELVATTCPGCGNVGVYFRGHLLRRINLHAAHSHNRQVINVATFRAIRWGTLVLRSLSNRRVIIDGVAVSQR